MCDSTNQEGPDAMKVGSRAKLGFTLVEMMVSVVLTTIICVLVADIASRSVETVGTASGKMTATEKLARLHQLMAGDFAALPVLDDLAVLSASSTANGWKMSLRLPVKRREAGSPVTQSAWRVVSYEWDRGQAVLSRQEYLEGSTPIPGVPVVTGVMAWEPEFRASSDVSLKGQPGWTAVNLPTLLSLQARLTGVWEEGNRDEVQAAHEQGGLYSLNLPVGPR